MPPARRQLPPDLRDAGDAARQGHHPLLLRIGQPAVDPGEVDVLGLLQGDLLLVEHVRLGEGLAQVVLRGGVLGIGGRPRFWKLWMALLKSPLMKE